MVVLLVALGVALVVFGAVVLLRYPDRPGGTIRIRDVEVDSKGAGLPLVVLGAALVLAALLVPPPAQEQPGGAGDTGGTTTAVEPEVPALDVVPGTTCTTGFFAREPAVDPARVRSVELDVADRLVLAPGEPQDTEFGLVLSDTTASATPDVLGAIRLSRRAGVGFRVAGVVDDTTCQAVRLALADEPGVPAPVALGDYVWVAFRLADRPYVMLLNSSNANTEVLVTLRRAPG